MFTFSLNRKALFLSLFIFSVSLVEAAVETTAVPQLEPSDLAWHGFMSQGFIKSTSNNFLGNSQAGSFNLTEAGLNVRKTLSDRVDLGAQLFARKFGPTENFNAKFDWFYANYQHSNWIKFKAGRIKIPFGLYNEMSDIDAARVPILLPQALYPSQNRNYLLAQNGGQLSGFGSLGKYGSLGYHLYGGSINLDLPSITSTTLVVTQIDVPHIVGGRILWETPIEGFKTAFTAQKLSLKFNANQNDVPVKGELPVSQIVGSLEYTYRRKLTLSSEYARQYVEFTTPSAAAFPQTKTISERYYLMANYQLSDVIAPGIYYSRLNANVSKRSGRQNRQGDLAAYIRYDFTSNWLIKFEAHLMDGTAGLTTTLNDGNPLSSLNSVWGAFLVKTTAYF